MKGSEFRGPLFLLDMRLLGRLRLLGLLGRLGEIGVIRVIGVIGVIGGSLFPFCSFLPFLLLSPFQFLLKEGFEVCAE